MRRLAWLTMGLAVAVLGLAAAVGVLAATHDSSDDAERLAAQRFFRNYLVQQDPTAAADVRITAMVGTLPPDFPLFPRLGLLGSAFSDTDLERELIVGWSSADHADDIFEFYEAALDQQPWTITRDPRVVGIDFIEFTDADDATFHGELRVSQEGDRAIVVLIARNTLGAGGGSAGAS